MLTSSPFPATAARAGLLLRWVPARMSKAKHQQQHATTCQTEYATCWGGVGTWGLTAAARMHLSMQYENSDITKTVFTC